MGKYEYASMVPDHTNQLEEAKLWFYQSGNHVEKALKGKSNGGSVARKPNERGGNAMYRPSFVEMEFSISSTMTRMISPGLTKKLYYERIPIRATPKDGKEHHICLNETKK
ncbi:uncharacterized protein EAE98_009405 [Botrytis deweyae]|uniref:Uncharacterized protein n=1 Tax=Botrytis deweyae TaxID=2478750 RepID=A0ABQ7IBM0_9HELO|nr:uncharacterized protein EAE98_009405 [Botrytis deweyae]KAF7919085.1 hypothetical protein EAE98_009405 [Botrytis deweyae]